MKYKNTKTGIEIDVPSECGGDWELIEKPKKKGGGRKKGEKAAEPAGSAETSEAAKESEE